MPYDATCVYFGGKQRTCRSIPAGMKKSIDLHFKPLPTKHARLVLCEVQDAKVRGDPRARALSFLRPLPRPSFSMSVTHPLSPAHPPVTRTPWTALPFFSPDCRIFDTQPDAPNLEGR